MRPPGARYPYRAVTDLENITAKQDAVVRELEGLRRATLDPKLKRYLHEYEVKAREVQEWLAALRTEMRGSPLDDPSDPELSR